MTPLVIYGKQGAKLYETNENGALVYRGIRVLPPLSDMETVRQYAIGRLENAVEILQSFERLKITGADYWKAVGEMQMSVEILRKIG